jgi:hypothetical protein
MLIEVLGVLGFEQFDHWNTTFREAANGWLYCDNAEQLGLSINLSGIKCRESIVNVARLIERLRNRDVMQPFMAVVREIAIEGAAEQQPVLVEAELFQRLHMRYISEMRRSEHLEQRVRELEADDKVARQKTAAP